MHLTKLDKILPLAVALMLSACSSGSAPGPARALNSNAKHTFLIGNNASTSKDPADSAANVNAAAGTGAKDSSGAADKEAAGPMIKGSGKWSATVRQLERFQAVELRDCVKMQITAGKPQTVSVEADDNLINLIETRVEGGKLIVSAKDSFQTSRAPEVFVAMPMLTEIMHSGTGNLIISNVQSPSFFIDCLGSGTCYVGGRAITERINLTGEGKVDCVKLLADRVTAENSGSGDVLVAPLRQLDAKLTGKGNILYVGEPASVRKTDTGSGSIKQLNL